MERKKYKVALVAITLNPEYWPYAKAMMESAQKYFLKNHDVEYIWWTDMPDTANYGATIIPTQPIEWPYPTLLRYDLFLSEEQRLKEFDYIFYCDVDMLFVGEVGDEILGEGLTMAQHPMYALDRKFVPPYEPNPTSSAYIPRLGRINTDQNGKKWFEPLYAAGGFQGGTTESFITAMKGMKKNINKDFNQNYIAIWNDESHWNRYLFENPPSVVLSPSYVYPDSLIEEYYKPIWGRDYEPKLITITKKHTLVPVDSTFTKAFDDLKAFKQ